MDPMIALHSGLCLILAWCLCFTPQQIPVLFLHCWTLLPDFFTSRWRRAGCDCTGATSSEHNNIPLASDQMGLSAPVLLLPGCLVKANHHDGTMDSPRPIGGVHSGCFPGGKSSKITKIWIPGTQFSTVHNSVDMGCFNNDVIQYSSRIEVIKLFLIKKNQGWSHKIDSSVIFTLANFKNK